MNIVEIIAIMIVAAMMLDGLRIGLVRSLFNLVKLIIGLAVALLVCFLIKGVVPNELRYILPTAFILIIGIVLGILGAICRMFNIIDKLPVTRQLNRAAGLISGFIYGVICVWAFMVVVGYFTDTSWGRTVYDMIHESRILSYMYDLVPIHKILSFPVIK